MTQKTQPINLATGCQSAPGEDETLVRSFQFIAGKGWSAPLDRSLNSAATLVLAFGAGRFGGEPAVFQELREAFPDSQIVGCSTAGEILHSRLFDDTVAVVVMKFSRTRIALASAPVANPGDSRSAGKRLAEQLAGPGLAGVLVLSDGLNVNGSELVRGINERLPANVTVTGGLAGDGARFARTWVLDNGLPTDHKVCAVGFYGDRVRIGHGSRGGWDVFGPARRVTRSEGNILYELDGTRALDLYKRYLADRAAELPSSALLFPLRITPSDAQDVHLVRTVLSVDEASQSMTFAGDIPQGARAQLMRANFDRLISAAGESGLQAASGIPRFERSAMLSIAVSCVGRRLILGGRAEEELESSAEALGTDDLQIGFYSYGELSPYADGACDLHNQTMTITTICEI